MKRVVKKDPPAYYATSLTATVIDLESGEVTTTTNKLSRWYTNEEILTNTRVRRRLARKFWKHNPLFAYKVMHEAMPEYDYLTFCRDTQPTKKGKSRVPYSAKKEWIRKQFNNLENLSHQQINTLIDQMYNGKHWRVEVRTTEGYCTYTFHQKMGVQSLQEFVNWINQKRRSTEEVDARHKKMNIAY